ncbi:acyltransferase [Aneurinibacillus sp. Ricciae_BoGa-3]|uniref:acyltransferase n=1 Tax=Aneurinibacillus sp. Ricciae_BoGa-3 TaxID=3022697 RepID=UPI002341797C|nr:acyltransferase [Aneurinibacillus sp. Ricciae_BoGa-3]WCK55801.1 acyltransferase [Aneurinibacillus sp. Ricciae_BoGa-3]
MVNKNNAAGWSPEMDYLRGFAIAAVIIIHVTAYFAYIKSINSLVIASILLDIAAHFAVPLFIFISGFVLSLKYKRLRFSSLPAFYLKRAKSILPQYLLFTIVYTLYFNGGFSGVTPATIAHNFIWAGAAYHLWYYAVIVQVYVFFPAVLWIYNWFDSKNKSRLLVTASLCVQIAWNIYYIISPTPITIALSQVFYLVLGIYVSRTYNTVAGWVKTFPYANLITALGVLFFVGAISTFWFAGLARYHLFYSIHPRYFMGPAVLEPAQFFLSFVILARFAVKLARRDSLLSTVVKQIGKYSFGIYLIHVLVLKLVVSGLLNRFHLTGSNWLFYPLLFLLTLGGSYAIMYALSYVPASQHLFGVGSRNKRSRAKARVSQHT